MNANLTQHKKLFLTASRYWEGENPCFIHIKNGNGVFEDMLLVTAQSQRHGKTLGESFRALIKKTFKNTPQVYGTEEGNWILIDGHGLCIQILIKEMRKSLSFEDLFHDSEQIYWSEEDYLKHFPDYQEILANI
jgi:ribosomal silencing factor RsfS